MDLDAVLARRPALVARRRARPHQRAGQPPSEALPRRRGAAGGRHRRLHDRQHPARREPERRRRADHQGPRARDRARFDHRPGRRHRGHRPDARRPDPAPARGQGLCPGAGAARARPLLLAGQSDGAARAGAAPHRAARRRAAPHAHAGARHRRTLAGRRAGAGLRQRRSDDRPGSSATPSARPTGCTRPGRRSTSRRRAASA